MNAKASLITAVALVVFVLAPGIFGSYYTIDQTERGVILRNGAVTGTAEPGLGFKIPVVDEVKTISVKDQAVLYELGAYSRDQQVARLSIVIQYQPLPGSVADIYARFGDIGTMQQRLIQPKAQQIPKIVFGQFNAATAVQERERLNTEIGEALKAGIQGPFTITGIQVTDLSFSSAYEQSVEARMLAEVSVEKERQELERVRIESQQKVAQAEADAEARVTKAKAEAEATILQGEAEADAIKARGDALKENPDLIQLTQAERWNGVLPTTVLPTTAVPIIGGLKN